MRRGEPAKGGKEVGTRGLDVTQETTKSHRERLRQGTSIEPPAYGSYQSGGRFWKIENETMVTKKSLDRSEGPQTGGGAQRWAQPKRELAVKGELEPQFLRPSDSLSGSSGFGKSPRPQYR